MILLDTDIIIDFLRNYPPAIDWLKSQESNSLLLPGFVKMEIIQGCRNKEELQIILSFLSNYKIIWPQETTSENATNVFTQYFLSHGIGIIDAIIGQIAVDNSVPIATFNDKHYSVIPGINIVHPYQK